MLRAFAEALRLHVEALGAVTAAVLDHNAIIGISGPLATGVRGVSASRRAPYQWPQWRHPITRSGAWSGPQAGIFFVHSPRRLADLGVKQRCCARESACGNMPLPLIQPDLASGALLRLSMPDHKGGIYRFGGIWRRDTPPGPAAAWLLNQFLMLGAADIEEAGLSDI